MPGFDLEGPFLVEKESTSSLALAEAPWVWSPRTVAGHGDLATSGLDLRWSQDCQGPDRCSICLLAVPHESSPNGPKKWSQLGDVQTIEVLEKLQCRLFFILWNWFQLMFTQPNPATLRTSGTTLHLDDVG